MRDVAALGIAAAVICLSIGVGVLLLAVVLRVEVDGDTVRVRSMNGVRTFTSSNSRVTSWSVRTGAFGSSGGLRLVRDGYVSNVPTGFFAKSRASAMERAVKAALAAR